MSEANDLPDDNAAAEPAAESAAELTPREAELQLE